MKTKVIENRWLPAKGFTAVTLFGLVFTRRRSDVTGRVLRHELIHCRQQLEWLYLPFFALYGLEWLLGMLRHGDSRRAYREISFEREAYAHDGEPDYLKRRRPFANYRRRQNESRPR